MNTQMQPRGYSLVELLVVIMILAILATTAIRSLNTVVDTGRTEETKQRLERLAHAIVGNPQQVANGTRVDYGYVGDIGAMPPNLDALITNPGYATWNGPYVKDVITAGGASTEFKKDAWGGNFAYSGSAAIASSGGGTAITRTLAASVNDILYNPLIVTVTDFAQSSPGSIYKDSIRLIMTIPNGAGGTVNRIKYPARDGYVRFDSLPIGQHMLQAIYIPNADTIRQRISIEPGRTSSAHVQLFRQVW